jgi:hypothetical protein
MENLNTQIVQATEEYLQSDKLKEYIISQAEKMVNEAVKEAFSWSGNVKKQIDDVVKNQLSININDLGIHGHNKFITEVVQEKLHQFLRSDVEVEITKTLNDMLEPIEKVVSIQKLKEKLFEASEKECVDSCCDDMDYILENYDEDDLYTFIVEVESKYNWVNIYLDKEPNKSENDCEFKLCVHETFTTFKQDDREIKAKDKLMNPYKWDIEKFIYQMFLAGSTINYEEAKALR